MVMSCSQISKKDDVQKISTSVFVTNFPGGKPSSKRGYERVSDLVLDETCLNHEDLLLCLLRKVKGFASLTNLKVVLGKEVYVNIKLKYMGGFWVIVVFQDDETKKSRITSRWGTLLNGEELEDEGYHSNRICISTKLKTVVFDSFKIVYRGMTCWVRAIEERGWVPDFEEDGEEGYDVNDGSHEDDMYGGVSENLKDVEGESDREEVPETNFEEVLNKKRDGKNIDDKHEDSLKYPHGFTPNEEGDVFVEKVDNWSDENRVNKGKKDGVCEGQHVHERVEVSNDTHESTCSGHFKKSEVPHKGGSILELIDDLINVRQTMGYDMTRRIKNMEEIIKSKGNWDGEVVIMGDFNELCDISERFGSLFNKHGAEAFNSFIVNAGLVEVPLDHRPIIMHDAHYDYGPIPFKFFNYWFKPDGFDKKSILKVELADLNGVIDKGEGSDADGHRRREVVRLIQEEEKADAMKVAQKAKIKWSIEVDKKSKYYHGVLNKKRGRLTIRGVLVDGIWMESPHLRDFVKRISLEQNDDLERNVSNEEIKRAVWDCGIDKAPSPDSFTFGFYRRYWDIIGSDVLMLSNDFFCMERSQKELLLRFWHHLVTVLDDIVDEIQSAFMTDRQTGWINLNKSNLMGIFVDSNKVKHAAAKIDVNSKKPSWVRWNSVLAAKDVGGLGESSLFALNQTLMFKWVWRFVSQKNSLWVRVVKALHGGDGNIG
nr:RNA-directed DNA polymerase, eukaryota [Tanacetum cinerariifolium]